jgi:glutamyl-tRNA synthetase
VKLAISQSAKDLIRKFALKNAIDYGKAAEGAVISKVIASDPSVKSDMPALAKEVRKTVSEINKSSNDSLTKEFEKYAAEFRAADAEKAERSAKHNFSIEGAEKGKFITRFPPEPGGYMHIGHAKPVFVEDELRKVYSGKLYLYFDDTNPDNEKEEFVGAFHKDLDWLGVKFDKEYYASDNLPMLYKYAEETIRKGRAYVCSCDAEKIGKERLAGKACVHKKQSKDENLALWKKMLEGKMKDNEAILRLNSEMDAVNTTMRDPTLFRIKHAKHYRQGEKYSVWPTYDFCTPIIDSVNGITDVVRSKEYEMRDELYFAVLEMLGLRKPRITSFSRLEIADNLTSKRKIRELIAEKLISGWDDPRLVTIRALKRRGILPDAIREFALRFGMGKSESVVSIDMLLEINRKLVEGKAKRLFFVEDPVELVIEGLNEKSAEVTMKASNSSETDNRHYTTNKGLFINSKDAKTLKSGETVRLKDAFDIRIKKADGNKVTATNAGNEKGAEIPRIHWISKGDSRRCELWEIGQLLAGDAFNSESIVKKQGYIEGYAMKLAEGEIVQIERHGYYKLDDRKSLRFISL